ncbi:MAG: hypothetical protein NTV07_02485 [Candidatus Omnitrophica bacterium]|nr:hypothetical protein [Candidatus Omnitrophota bacterium]
MFQKRFAVLSAILIIAVMVTSAYAGQAPATTQTQATTKAQPKPTNGFVAGLRNIVHWPFRTTEKLVGTTTDTVKGAGTVITREAETVGSVATGKLGETPNLIVEPIKGTGETAAGAVKGVVTAPVEAGKEVSAEQKTQNATATN